MEENKKDIKGFALKLIIVGVIIVIACIIFFGLGMIKKNSGEIVFRGEVPNYTPTPRPTIDNNETNRNSVIERHETSDEIGVVPTLLDEITTNAAWCGTFQLVWNDMQNEVVGKDIEFNPQISIVENLNKQSFTENNISDEYYYKTYGLKTLKLKEEIEKGIKDKFNQKSDVLDKLSWDDVPKDDSGYTSDYRNYLFYTMLYREFNFKNPFAVLNNSIFEGTKDTYRDVEYFGIDKDTSESVYKQIYVLYYNSDEDFAVILNTKEGDQVLLTKGDNGNTFKEIYENVQSKSQNYKGNTRFTENDTFRVPKIKFNLLEEFTELENKVFYSKDGYECEIVKALQTIQFELDNKGGKIKSEAVIDLKETAALADPEPEEHRFFNFNSTFTMFLIEEGKELPYFAANIDDITLYQE